MADETRNYVPKLQAIKNIVADPARYGLVMADVPNAPLFRRRAHDDPDGRQARGRARRAAARRVPRAESAAQPAGDLRRRRLRDPAADRQGGDLRGEARSRRPAARVVAGAPDESRARRCRRSRSVTGCRSRRCDRSTASVRAQTVPTGYALLVPMQRPTAEAAASLVDAVFTTVPAGRTFFHTGRARRHAAGRRRTLRRDDAGSQALEQADAGRRAQGPEAARDERRVTDQVGGSRPSREACARERLEGQATALPPGATARSAVAQRQGARAPA